MTIDPEHVQAAIIARSQYGRNSHLVTQRRAERRTGVLLDHFRAENRGPVRGDSLAVESRALIRRDVAFEIAVIRQCRRIRKVALKG